MRRSRRYDSDYLKCAECKGDLMPTPSGFWVCPEGHGRLMSREKAVEAWREMMRPEWEKLRKQAEAKRNEERDRITKLPMATPVPGMANLYVLDDRPGMWRRAGAKDDDKIEVMMIYEQKATANRSGGWRRVVTYVKRAKRVDARSLSE